MLALATGWTQQTISGDSGGVSDDFRRACHWALFVRQLIPQGMPEVPSASGATPEQMTAIAAMARSVREIRASIYPDDDSLTNGGP